MEQSFFTDTTAINPIQSAKNGTLSLATYEKNAAWDLAMNVVDYPVYILPLFYEDSKNEFKQAEGTTNSGRYTSFHGVVVDRNRIGKLETISTVTNAYSTMSVVNVYKDLRDDLESARLNALPERVYVSGTGGSQQLVVKIDGLSTPVLTCGKFTMSLTVKTSNDGSGKHSVILSPMDEKGNTIFGLESELSFAAKHTKTVNDRAVSFSVVIDKLLSEWNEVVAPILTIMDGETFAASKAMEIIKEILESSGIPTKHIERCVNGVSTGTTHTMLSSLSEITGYVNENLTERAERIEQFKKSINKNAMKIIKKYVVI